MKRDVQNGWSLDSLFNNKFFARFCLNLRTVEIRASNFYRIGLNGGSMLRNTADMIETAHAKCLMYARQVGSL